MKHRVLDEEVKEAQDVVFGTLLAAGASMLFGAFAGAVGVDKAGLAAAPFVGVFGLAALFCLGWFWRARRTIRRWRDQERERLTIAEAERIGREQR